MKRLLIPKEYYPYCSDSEMAKYCLKPVPRRVRYIPLNREIIDQCHKHNGIIYSRNFSPLYTGRLTSDWDELLSSLVFSENEKSYYRFYAVFYNDNDALMCKLSW